MCHKVLYFSDKKRKGCGKQQRSTTSWWLCSPITRTLAILHVFGGKNGKYAGKKRKVIKTKMDQRTKVVIQSVYARLLCFFFLFAFASVMEPMF